MLQIFSLNHESTTTIKVARREERAHQNFVQRPDNQQAIAEEMLNQYGPPQIEDPDSEFEDAEGTLPPARRSTTRTRLTQKPLDW